MNEDPKITDPKILIALKKEIQYRSTIKAVAEYMGIPYSRLSCKLGGYQNLTTTEYATIVAYIRGEEVEHGTASGV